MEYRELYNKYKVERTEGEEGNKPWDGHYFVLSLLNDEDAMPALKSYALTCLDSDKPHKVKLGQEIFDWIHKQ